MLAHTVYCMHAGKDAPKLTIDDFMPGSARERRELTPEELLAKVKVMHRTFQKVPERGARKRR